MKMIVGLGNIGNEYAGTRHNTGFMAVEKFAAEHDIEINKQKMDAMFGTGMVDGEKVMVVEPTTYMNESGRAVHPIAVRFVYEAAQTVDIPIIGVGGINTIEDALELLMAGASAVQVGEALAHEPNTMLNIINALPDALDNYNFENVDEVTQTFKK